MKNNEPITKSIAVKSSIWKLMESFLSKGVSMVVSIVLARLIAPEAYGIIALTAVFINLTDILIQAGFSTTLIRKEHVTDEDYSTVLCISVMSSIILYIIIFINAPYIAGAYDTPLLSSVLRVISLTLFCQAFAAVRTAVVARTMRFKNLFFCTIISNIASGLFGIIMATLGYGVWALVFQQLSYQVILTILLLFNVHIKYKFGISKKSIHEIVTPSLKILFSSLLSFLGDSLYSIVIGKVYSMKDLAYYDKGALFPRSFSLYTFSAVSNVFLPVFASYQNDYKRLNEIFRRVLNILCFVILPLMAGLCMVAEPLISVILTDKWLPAVGIMRWNCLYYTATPIFLANVQLHFAIGKNETRIKTEIIRILLMGLMFIGLMFLKASVTTIAAVLAGIQIVILVFIMFETHNATGYRVLDTIKDIIPSFISVALMCISVYFISQQNLGNLILLVVEILVGCLVYWSTSVIFRNKAYIECLDMVKSLIQSKRKSNDY